MNNKLNYKKGYKNEILRLIYMCGLIPYRSLRILAAEPRLYQRAIRKMEEDGVVAIDKKGGEKNIRLLSKRERRKDYEYLLPPEYIEYYENTIYNISVKRLSGGNDDENPVTATSAIRSCATKIMMYSAGVDISPYKRNIKIEKIEDEDVIYYDSIEIKTAENYTDEVTTVKNKKGEMVKNLQNSKVNGMLISPGGAYAVYNIGKSLIEWKRYGEMKMASYISGLVRHKSESEVSINAPKEAIIISQIPSLFVKICNGKAEEKNRKKTLINIDFAYDRLYAVTEDTEGVLMLKMMLERGWRAKIFDAILERSEQENSKYVSVQCDGYNKQKDIYKLIFCVPDLTSLQQFVKRAKIEKNKDKFVIYCFTCQELYVSQIAGKNNVKIMTIDINYFYNKYYKETAKLEY